MTDLPEVLPKPCNECPWRRKAAPGWLGPHTAVEWIQLAHSEAPIACHRTVGEDDGWDEAQIRQCAGAAQFRKNVFKMPRDKQVAIAEYRNEEDVFGRDIEFVSHHGGV